MQELQPEADLAGKAALVTGAGSGIGAATAELLASRGCRVTVLDIQSDSTEVTVERIKSTGGDALAFAGDIKRPDVADRSVQATVEAFGRLDFLFNNAGYEHIASLTETSESDWDQVINTNLKGTYLMSRAAMKIMVASGGGGIVNNASDAGLRGIKINAAYSASKAGVIHLTRSIALDYGRSGIRCNCICPGCIRTPLCERFNEAVAARKGLTGEEVLAEFADAHIPMGRIGTPEEVACVVAFLFSHEARYINGAIIPVDGGLTAGM